MAFAHSLTIFSSFCPSVDHTLLRKNPALNSKLHFGAPTIPLLALRLSSQKLSVSATEDDILQAVANSDGSEGWLPAVRTFENDLARLTLVGTVDLQQALTAAAADGGEAADEHIASGVSTMVVETVFPGPADKHSTVSTRLFLPARKVKEKAKRLTLSHAEMSGTMSRNILAMTFRQVVLQQLWNFELLLFVPGTERNMIDLECPREVPTSFTLSSSDEHAISVLGEVVCLSALESTKEHVLSNLSNRVSSNLFQMFHKPKKIVSKDSSVILYNLLEHDLVASARSLLEKFNLEKANYKPIGESNKYDWWTSLAFCKLEKLGGAQFSTWIKEYLPCYRLQIDPSKLVNLKLQGWQKSPENKWEILLTHSQMVALANILDMYFEDLFTLPKKQISCGMSVKFRDFSVIKLSSMFPNILFITVAGGVFLATISTLSRFHLHRLPARMKYSEQSHSLELSHFEVISQQSLGSGETEDYCLSIIQKVKEAFNWSGEITSGTDGHVWIGEIPAHLRTGQDELVIADPSSTSISSEESDMKVKATEEDIASYQVALSEDGEIIAFQPTNHVAVSQWASKRLVVELYGEMKGTEDRDSGVSHSKRVSNIELLISRNPSCCFALARPAKSSVDVIAKEE